MKTQSDAKKLYDQLNSAHAALGIAKTFLMFHGRESDQLKNCVELISKHEDKTLKMLCKFEDKYWNPTGKGES